MVRKFSRAVAAGAGALMMLAGAAVYAGDAPVSVNESGRMIAGAAAVHALQSSSKITKL